MLFITNLESELNTVLTDETNEKMLEDNAELEQDTVFRSVSYAFRLIKNRKITNDFYSEVAIIIREIVEKTHTLKGGFMELG